MNDNSPKHDQTLVDFLNLPEVKDAHNAYVEAIRPKGCEGWDYDPIGWIKYEYFELMKEFAGDQMVVAVCSASTFPEGRMVHPSVFITAEGRRRFGVLAANLPAELKKRGLD